MLLERVTPAELFDAVARHRVSVLFTAPTAYRAALGRIDEYDLTSLRRCVSAGEALSSATWHAFHDATGHRIIDGIGSTELLHIFISAFQCAGPARRAGSNGLPLPSRRATAAVRAQRVEHHQRHLPPGRGRVLLVPGQARGWQLRYPSWRTGFAAAAHASS